MKITHTKANNRLTVKLKSRISGVFFAYVVVPLLTLLIAASGAVAAKKSGIGISTIKDWSKQIWFWVPYHTKALFLNPNSISIHIKHTDYQQLAYQREKAMASSKYHKIGMDFTYVPAKIETGGKLIPAKIRLKGDRQIHFDHDNQWSFRIKAKKDNAVFRMKHFSIHKPGGRNFIHEWIFHQVLAREGLISGRYFFGDVKLNGENLGVYAFEEHFEKRLLENNRLREAPILKFEENRARNYRVSLIAPFDEDALSDPVQLSHFNKANELLEGFRRGDITVSKVLDPLKTGKYFAITDLLQVPHGGLWKSIRFYYNPVTSFIEPIGYDGHHGIDKMRKNQYLACEIGVNDKAGWIHVGYGNWFHKLFNDSETFDNEFISSYFSALWDLTNPEYLDSLYANIGEALEANLTLIARDVPLFADHALYYGPDLFTYSNSTIYDRQTKIRDKLSSIDLHAHLESFEDNTISLDLGNPEMLPIVIKGLLVGDSLLTQKSGELVLPARQPKENIEYHSISFSCDPRVQNFIKSDINSVRLLYSLPGWGQTMKAQILPTKQPLSLPESIDIIRNPPSIEKYAFLEIDSLSNSIFLKTGTWIIDQDIVFPSGYNIYGAEGLEINLIEGAGILSYSPLILQGSEDLKIHIFSSDTSGQGIAVISADESSILEYVDFENLSAISRPGWNLTSAITFYESDVRIKNCSFSTNFSEDYVNMIRCKFSIEESEFNNTFSDAFDADYADGSFQNCIFIDCGNDAIDISGSQVQVRGGRLAGVGDKALSAGEKSMLTATNVDIHNAEIAVASKDLSKLIANSVNVHDSRIGYTAFQKKPEYGKAEIRVSKGSLNQVEVPYLLEHNSVLIVDNVSQPPDRKNVQEILYGVEYGKTSKPEK